MLKSTTALAATDQALHDAPLDGAAGRQAFVVLQALLRKIERCITHQCRHWDFYPFLTWSFVAGTVARSKPAAQSQGPCDSLTLGQLRLAIASQAFVGRISQHRPDRGAFPTSEALA